MKDYYVGLDIGTNSVGWAVTDEAYNICKFKKKSMWGIRLFDGAATAADRRTKRAARRRLQRKKQRIDLLQDLFKEEIAKVDRTFFIRLNESRLYLEDKEVKAKHPLFADQDYTDIEYHQQYPTVFHLRKELMESREPHDIRLVYLAIHHILKNRGHFLIDGDLNSAKSFADVFEKLRDLIETELEIEITVESEADVENILRDKKAARSKKATDLAKCLAVEEGEFSKEEIKRRKAAIAQICKWIVGNKGDITKVFGEIEGLEKTSFAFSETTYDESVRGKLEECAPDLCVFMDIIKAVYDWNVLVDVLDGEEFLSMAKVKQYQLHKDNLTLLKKMMKKYTDKTEYKKFFDDKGGVNYAGYIGSVQTRGKKHPVKRCSEEDFYKALGKVLEKMKIEVEDQKSYEFLVDEVSGKRLLPLQRSKDNGSVPRQVHEVELKLILQNAEQYLPFLSEKDDSGLSVSEKILKIFQFRVPYYVGPLSDRHAAEGANVWIRRKEEGRIYPWNFDEKVDHEASNEAFIQRMTNKCTYLIGEDVVPKNSLLYSKFMVLNELNNLKIRGKEISVELKQDIYQNLFCRKTRVTGKELLKYLHMTEADNTLKAEDLAGFDGDFKANMSSYLDFQKQVFGDRIAEDGIRKMIENIIKWKTIYGDDQKMLGRVIESHYPGQLSKDQMKAVGRLHYSGWGNLCAKFLTGIEGVDLDTGETMTIMQALWNTNFNLMQLLSDRFTFKKETEAYNAQVSDEITEISYDALVRDLYVSPAVKRSIWQTIEIVEEVQKVMGRPPKKIFVEMARGEDKDKSKDKNKNRTVSRKQRLLELYANCENDVRDWVKEIDDRDEREFSSIKLYLYYTQMGKCMYTGEEIDLHELMDANSKWDRDHIYPQSLVKDDSLDNLVLVKKSFNAKKSNELLSAEIRQKQIGFWTELLKKGLISKKKYERLTRKDDFSDDELAGFINRQLVETRQSSKTVVELLGRVYTDTRIVPVKAGLASDFRHKDLNVLKSRRVNDYHHAKDAYLNIVAGDVYDAKFTSNPRTWLKEKKNRNYSLNRVFDFNVCRKDKCIWEGVELGEDKKAKRNEKGEKYGGTLDRIRENVKKNDILYTEYTYCEKGQLFNETIARKTDGAKIALKAGLDPEKYGGYTSANTSYFALIEFDGKKGERVKNIMEVPIYVANMLAQNPNAYVEYCQQIKGLKNVKVLRQRIKKNALISVNGFPMRLRGANEEQNLLKSNLQLISKNEETIRRIEKFLDKNPALEVDEKRDGLTAESLLAVYDEFTEKLLGAYRERPANQGTLLEMNREKFLYLSLKEKAVVLNQILTMLRCDIATTANLLLVGGTGMAGSMKRNKNTIGKSKLILINQSVTGLFENRIEL